MLWPESDGIFGDISGRPCSDVEFLDLHRVLEFGKH